MVIDEKLAFGRIRGTLGALLIVSKLAEEVLVEIFAQAGMKGHRNPPEDFLATGVLDLDQDPLGKPGRRITVIDDSFSARPAPLR